MNLDSHVRTVALSSEPCGEILGSLAFFRRILTAANEDLCRHITLFRPFAAPRPQSLEAFFVGVGLGHRFNDPRRPEEFVGPEVELFGDAEVFGNVVDKLE